MATPKGTIPWNKGKGNGYIDNRGYRRIYADRNGKRREILEHRHVMEQYLGRELKSDEVVHHKNHDILDNRLENLEVMTWSQHTTHHQIGSSRSLEAKRTIAVMAAYREEVKQLKQINLALLAALEAFVDGRPISPPPPIASVAYKNWQLFEQARAASASAREVQS